MSFQPFLFFPRKTDTLRDSLAVQWLELSTFLAESTDLIPGRGTKILQVLQPLPKNQTHWWKHTWQQILGRMWGSWIIHMSLLGIESGSATLENTLAAHFKTRSELNIQPSNCILGHLFQRYANWFLCRKCTLMFIADLFINSPKLKTTHIFFNKWASLTYSDPALLRNVCVCA